jgi:hypothetical protein
VVAKAGLRNVPERALYSWEPTAMLGVYRMDEFYWERAMGREARLGSAGRAGLMSGGAPVEAAPGAAAAAEMQARR